METLKILFFAHPDVFVGIAIVTIATVSAGFAYVARARI